MTDVQFDAVVVRCMDGRLHNLIANILKEINVNSYDLISVAGATKVYVSVVQQIQVSIQLHHITRVILIHHEDCGAYGDVPEKTHEDAMWIVKNWLDRLNLDITVECYFLRLNGEYSSVNF